MDPRLNLSTGTLVKLRETDVVFRRPMIDYVNYVPDSLETLEHTSLGLIIAVNRSTITKNDVTKEYTEFLVITSRGIGWFLP